MNTTDIPDARLSQKKIEAIYNRMSHFYDIWGLQAEGRARNRGIELAQVRDGEKVLEVATGTGLILAEIAPKNPGGFNLGLDISPGMLQKARQKLEKYPNVELKQAGALEIPSPDSTFDLLINAYMFDLLPHDQMPGVLTEFWRVLKPDGRLVMINMTRGEKPGSQLYQWVYNFAPSIMGGCRGIRLSSLIKKAGFELVTREYHQQLLFPSEVILARKSMP